LDLGVFADAEAACREAAGFVAAETRAALAARGHGALALSGGGTPLPMLRALASEGVPWDRVDILQVDERVAPEGGADRNLTALRDCLPGTARIHPMPVTDDDLDAAAVRYAGTLTSVAGSPPMLDLVHLGLGGDGHTASLVPGDPVLDVDDRDVAMTAPYQGRRRMTLTYPALDRARQVLWLVTGAGKAAMLARLGAGDAAIPAGRVRCARAVAFADHAAAARLV